MKLAIAKNRDAVAAAAASELSRICLEAIDARGSCTIALSGGGTPVAMVHVFATHPLPWDRVNVFQVDERIVPAGDAARNVRMLREHLLAAAPIPPGNLHAIPVDGYGPEEAADAYVDVLREECGVPPVLDVIQLGLGGDGHTASLVPGDPVLDVDDRDVAVTDLYKGYRRVTLTYPAINRSRRILWLVAGPDKAEAFARLVAADLRIPAGRVARERALLFADAQAVGTRKGARTTGGG